MTQLGKYELNRIYTGDCLEVLRQIPDGVFQTCVTSPPYWGLRDYGIEPQVWGGDPGCEHEWGDEKCITMSPHHLDESIASTRGGGHKKAVIKSTSGAFCLRCNAWRGSLGLEPTPELYVQHLVEIFREVKRVLRDDGTFWLNLGDSYAGAGDRPGGKGNEHGQMKKHKTPDRAIGLKPKDLVGIPWRVAFALQADGWWLRSDIIWHKPNCMPESVRDRPTKSHEYLFLLAKSKSYYYDQDAVREPYTEPLNRWGGPTLKSETGKHSEYLEMQKIGNTSAMRVGRAIRPNESGRNKRTVWTIPTRPFKEAHFATFPPKLIEPCIKAGTSAKGACPECGKGWGRMVEVSGGTIGRSWHNHEDDLALGQRAENEAKGGHGYKREFIGWQRACRCDGSIGVQDPIPQIVLDPFMGAGTTGLVAKQLRRNWFGIEINPEYCEMARQRIANEPPPLFVLG